MRLAFLLLSLVVLTARGAEPITIVGPTTAEQGLPQVPGVKHIEVYRAPADGWTYNHHVDMAVWKGRMYVAWDACEKDEDVGISRELYSTSKDGTNWSKPELLFPQGLSTAMRMYFFRAPNGRMLAVAGFRTTTNTISEAIKHSLIVREIRPNHSLGEVFLLRQPGEVTGTGVPVSFVQSKDKGFVEACNQLWSNKPFLEQQDYGRLLGDRRLKWHDLNLWPADEPSRAEFPNRFGKAMCFFHRADGALVSTMKWGWVMVSHDEGETWSQPVRPPSLVAGMAKTWGQRVPAYQPAKVPPTSPRQSGNQFSTEISKPSDARPQSSADKYVLFYNPHLLNRFPLVMVHGNDGVTFGNMRIVNGERPPMRHPGLYKVEGPQYVRGISEWSNDGSWKDKGIWIVYSMNKEDIWVSRVPRESIGQ